MEKPLNVAFLWHMHQPYYRNIESDKFILPWVRLHGVKDYYDMAAILDKYPKIKQSFNLVPSLLLQVEEYIAGKTDIFMDMTLKPAAELAEDEKAFVVYNFFMANWPTMVYPHPRYGALLKKRGENVTFEEVKSGLNDFKENDIRDLQVWFNLAWIDPDFFEMFPELRRLREKGEGFTEEEKKFVIKTHIEILKMIIPKYTEMYKSGQIELSTTPFYHPILPLLCDTDSAKECMPDLKIDFNFSQPADAEYHIQKSIEYFRGKYGSAPKGMWPSEGSVSAAALNLIRKNGIEWAATDEAVLYESLKLSGIKPEPEAALAPCVFNTEYGPINLFFRNRYLSDLIGFTYQGWNPREAAGHFINELDEIRRAGSGEGRTVSIILDGENAWEYYPNDGKDFLNELYSRLSDDNRFKTVTMSEAAEITSEKIALKKIFPGSWIDHNFAVWIGHEDDHKSWKLLKKTRGDLVKYGFENPDEKEKLKKAWESVYIAEGSDWNWWYGDDHSSKNDAEFDNLYRMHLMNVYKTTGLEIPGELYEPIGIIDKTFEARPQRFITPVLDGRDTGFYEWRGAGMFDLSRDGGAMHNASKAFSALHYGFDRDNFYFRLDPAEGKIKKGITFDVKFHGEDADKDFLCEIGDGSSGNIEVIAGEIIEARISFDELKEIFRHKEIMFELSVLEGGKVLQKIPEKGYTRLVLPGEDFELYNWRA